MSTNMCKKMNKLKKKWKKSKSKKKFTDFFSAKKRKYMCDYPTFKPDSFCVLNLPTLHFKIHWFDYFKKILYQMNSRKYTGGKSVAEIQAMRGKESLSNYKVQPQQCLNPKCFKICKGHVFLKNHVMSKKQPKNVCNSIQMLIT